MGDVAEGWLSQLVDLPQALAAYVTLVPPRWVFALEDAAIGCVPAARVMVEYVRFRLSRRQSDPTGLPVYLATPVTSLRQLTLLLNLDLLASFRVSRQMCTLTMASFRLSWRVGPWRWGWRCFSHRPLVRLSEG